MTRPARAQDVREKSARPKVWRPPSTLDAPPAPEGFVHRWIRYETNGFDDRKNMSARLREGYELVRGSSRAHCGSSRRLRIRNEVSLQARRSSTQSKVSA